MLRTLAIILVPALIFLALGIVALQMGREDSAAPDVNEAGTSEQSLVSDLSQKPDPTELPERTETTDAQTAKVTRRIL